MNLSNLNRLLPDLSPASCRCIAVIFAALLLMPSQVFACVGCRVAGDEVRKVEPETVTAGLAFSWSVLFMLVVVFLLITFMVSYISRMVSRLDKGHSDRMP